MVETAGATAYVACDWWGMKAIEIAGCGLRASLKLYRYFFVIRYVMTIANPVSVKGMTFAVSLLVLSACKSQTVKMIQLQTGCYARVQRLKLRHRAFFQRKLR